MRHPDTKELFVNFDPQLITLIRETECMHKMGLEIPYNAKALKHMEPSLKKNSNALEVRNYLLYHDIVSINMIV